MESWLTDMEDFDTANGTTTNIIFCNVPPNADATVEANVQYMNGLLDTMIAGHSNPNIIYVDIYTPLKECWSYIVEEGECNFDRTHPTGEGYNIIKNEIYEAIISAGLD